MEIDKDLQQHSTSEEMPENALEIDATEEKSVSYDSSEEDDMITNQV